MDDELKRRRILDVSSASVVQCEPEYATNERIRALREEAGLSQEALADAARLHRTHISLIERGQRSVQLQTIESLARALRVQPADLMPEIAFERVRVARPR